MLQAITQGNVQMITPMVQGGYPIEEPLMEPGITILMHVSALCGEQAVQQILALQPDVNTRDAIGRSALHYACRSGNADTFRALVGVEECEIDAITNAGVSPLMCAVDSGNIELVVLCLNEKLNPFLKDALDRSALDYARHFNNVQGHNMRELI
eukprot:CAMPEP_0185602980 /NCGR_PEP_ID=MMETSP0436-20130131/2127_1 /TAXON_ID=626734 ORGANISM="Favella taraikaensis, Strain Fe Narragansett Bay" /NCGR_SAMPLE_ID=MMETSP0436 /ASSEMBLY_ACC=CAM_ASM_000390 /LENGTH=153 /DNA_ID=CAMNT_0028233307 /DNA_START=54 /DNA_END=515 /DNA_ORIENTATION=+